jgi:hypothetical protein
MKRVFILFAIAFIAMSPTCSQKDFEGSVTYVMELEGDFVGMMEAYMPDSYIFSFKDNKTLLRINGGMLESIMGKMLIDNITGTTYIINDAEKTVFKLGTVENPDDIDTTQTGPVITELDEKSQILGYSCKKYKILYNQGGNEYVQYVWATKEIDIRLNAVENSGIPGSMNFFGLDAFPLKIESKIAEGGIEFTMVLTATELESEKLDAKDFSIPDDYQEKEFDNIMNIMK